MKKTFAFCLSLTPGLAFFSCQHKSKVTVTPAPVDSPIVYADYMALKPGNYWIYQNFRLDSANGAAHAQGSFDSSYVEKDTVIAGKTYHKFMDVQPLTLSAYNTYFLRDSLGYVVDQFGHIIFSSTDFTDTFRVMYSYPDLSHPDTIKVTEQMGFKDVPVTVNAGTFVTSTFRQIWHWPPSLPYGPIREYDFTYAKGIGLIRKTTGFYTALPEVYERRLERYHVQ